MVVDIKVCKICRPHCTVAALRGTDDGSCHFLCTVLAALYGAGVCLCPFLTLDVVYLQIYCQARVGRRYDKTNVRWQGSRHSELLTLENHVYRTK